MLVIKSTSAALGAARTPPSVIYTVAVSSLYPFFWLSARAMNLTLKALEQFQCPVITHCEADKSSGHLTIQNIVLCTFFFLFSFAFVVAHRNKLPRLETDIEQWLSSSSRKIQNICKKILFLWHCSLSYGFNPHFLHARIYCCEWNNYCFETFYQSKNAECLSFPKI